MPKYKVRAIVEHIYETENEIEAIKKIKRNGFKNVDIIRVEKVQV
jgi:hypothetical protein